VERVMSGRPYFFNPTVFRRLDSPMPVQRRRYLRDVSQWLGEMHQQPEGNIVIHHLPGDWREASETAEPPTMRRVR
jgi:hypothetical protein